MAIVRTGACDKTKFIRLDGELNSSPGFVFVLSFVSVCGRQNILPFKSKKWDAYGHWPHQKYDKYKLQRWL